MALFLDISTDDVLRIGDTILTLERKSGTRARIRINGGAQCELIRGGKITLEQNRALSPGGNPVGPDEE